MVQRRVRPQGNTPTAFRLQDSTTSPLRRLSASSRKVNTPVFASKPNLDRGYRRLNRTALNAMFDIAPDPGLWLGGFDRKQI